MSHTHENVYLGVLPKRVVLCCVDNDAYNGTFAKNPFHAKHNKLNFLALYVDGQQVPAKPLQPKFGADGTYVRSYFNLFAGTGKVFQDEGNDITRQEFAEGYTLFAFDITLDCCDGPHFNLVHKGNLRVEMHFDDPLEQTVNVIVYGEFESVLEIDRNRNVVYDY